MPVEEQTQHNSDIPLVSDYQNYGGQRLTIPDRQVTKLAFVLRRVGSPSGNVTFYILDASDDSVLLSKVWGAAGDLPTENTLVEVTFDSPAIINGDVRILAYSPGHSLNNDVRVRYQNTDVKADELTTYGDLADWTDESGYDTAYRYTYELPGEETAYNTMVGSPTSWGWQKCDYGGAEKCPVGSEPSWTWQAPTSEGPNKTPQGGPPSFIWGSE